MRQALHHPIRSIGIFLTLAGALTVVALLVAPSAVSGASKDKVSFYSSFFKGSDNVIQKIGEDEDFNVNGSNLNKAVEVFCYAGKEADDGTGISGFDTVSDWHMPPTSSKLIEGVDMDPDCDGNNGVGLKSAIMVEFEHGVVADPTDDAYVVGPPIFVKDQQKP